jgi:heme-degrading monooxygenase HmoA
MIAVIFEVKVDPARGERYFELAGALREKLDQTDGFISIERFQSLADEEKYLSLSFWRDREAVEAWYAVPSHRDAQVEGRNGIFQDYRIRVAEVFRDYDMEQGRPQGSHEGRPG